MLQPMLEDYGGEMRTTTLGRMLYSIQWSMRPTLSLHAHACLVTDVNLRTAAHLFLPEGGLELVLGRLAPAHDEEEVQPCS